MIPVQLIVAGAIAAASFGGAWVFQESRYEAILAERASKQATALAVATANALAETVRLQEAKDEAERKHQSRLADLRRDLARTRSVADGLRNDIATARATLPDATCGSVREYGIAASIVIGECSARLVEVAEHADRAIREVILLKDAWPTVGGNAGTARE